jgi:hypothetical protein
MKNIALYWSLGLSLLAASSFGELPNLFPNGGVENEFVNQIIREDDYATSVRAEGSGVPTFWRLGSGAALCRDGAHSGAHSIELQGGEKEVSATVYSDYWRVKEAAMPFGTPLLPKRDVRVVFYYRTSPELRADALEAELTLGVIKDLDSDDERISLDAATEWTRVELRVKPAVLRWGAELTFRLSGDAEAKERVWIDDIHLSQDIGDPLNLAHNPGFERGVPGGGWPASWDAPTEDQWVSWVGKRYRRPQLSRDAKTGRQALRASATYADVSGVSQVIELNQDRARPIGVGIWSRLDNSIGNGPGGTYYGSDNLPNLTLFVHHQDGTMQEVPPTFSLGESDHGWDYRRGGFMPQKPVERIRVQATLMGTEPTTSLWLDDVSVFEIGDDAPFFSAATAPSRTIQSAWGSLVDGDSEGVVAANDSENLYVSVPRRKGDRLTRIYLNTTAAAEFSNHHRFLMTVIRIGKKGEFSLGTAVEKQGYVVSGKFTDALAAGLGLQRAKNRHVVRVPFQALRLASPTEASIGFNVQWETRTGSRYWSGKSASYGESGMLVLASSSGLSIERLRFGQRYLDEQDHSQDLISHPPIYAGWNDGTARIANAGAARELQLTAGVVGRTPFTGVVQLAADETKPVPFRYDAGSEGLGAFEISLSAGEEIILREVYPLVVPPSIEVVLDQEYYFPEEADGAVEIHTRIKPLPEGAWVKLSVRDRGDDTVMEVAKASITETVDTVNFPLGGYRINELPVQDYEVLVSLHDGQDALLAETAAPFGRINHTKQHVLPPIETVETDETGRLIINGDFRFFPIVPSMTSADWDAGIALGGNMHRPIYRPDIKDDDGRTGLLAEVDKAWKKGAYLLPIGPGPSQTEAFEAEKEALFKHPGFLGCYAKQFYHWNLTDELLDYRKQVEGTFAAQNSSRLLVWGHHDSSFLYDHDVPPWPRHDFPVGYCYVKIMSRPGSGWRNAPFLTLTEEVLDESRFKLAEVNLYLAWHDDEIVPEHFSTYLSIRGDNLRGFRCESYLSVIYGADGLYHYICNQKGGLQRLRGWFQEMSRMWPVFAADDAELAVTVSPSDAMIETRLKRYEGKLYLLTANGSDSTRQATISIEGNSALSVRKLFDLPGDMRQDDGAIADTWLEEDVFVYEITESRKE